MKSYVRMFEFDELEAESGWLNSLSRQGKNLMSTPELGCIYRFEESDNNEYVYAVDVKPKAYYQDPDRLALFRQTGWQWMGSTFGGRHYLRRKASMSGANKVDTSPAEEKLFLQQIKSKLKWGLAGFAIMFSSNLFHFLQYLEAPEEFWTYSPAMMIVANLLLLAGVTIFFRKISKLNARIEQITL